MNFVTKTILALFGTAATTGCITDSGYHTSYSPGYSRGTVPYNAPLASDLEARGKKPFLSYLQQPPQGQGRQEQHIYQYNVPSPEEEAMMRQMRKDMEMEQFRKSMGGFIIRENPRPCRGTRKV